MSYSLLSLYTELLLVSAATKRRGNVPRMEGSWHHLGTLAMDLSEKTLTKARAELYRERNIGRSHHPKSLPAPIDSVVN